jgi:hypothetical protein
MTAELHAGIRRVAAIVGISAGIAVAMSACKREDVQRPTSTPIAGVKPAASQSAARRMAWQEDIPALDVADKLVIKTAPWAGAKEVTITSPIHLKELRSELIVTKMPPSGGMTWATLDWMKGERVIRQMWVFDYGEWGFERPSMSWTIGHNPELVTIIMKHLAAITDGVSSRMRSSLGTPGLREEFCISLSTVYG